MESNDEKFIKLAFLESEKSSQPVKCGTVVVKNGVVISSAHNSQRENNDPTAHSEIIAIREAAKKLGSKKLS